MGVIDGAHISIARPHKIHVVDYYHKPSRYSIVARVVVDCNKRLIYVFVGLPGSVNGSRVLCKFGVYIKAQHIVLFDIARGSQHEFPLYILGDKGYPLISWKMLTIQF
jgi:hypothetical protein